MKKSKKQLASKSHCLSLKMSSKLKASRMLDPAKFPHLKKCKKVVLEDRISALPDDLLSQILALLSLKEAVATSILSSRWKYLWTTRPNLIFGYDRVFERMDYKTYVRTINKVLELYSGRGLRDFRVFYPLRSGASCHLNYWIDFAITSGVSRLEVNLDTIVRDGRKYLYALPADIFQSGLKRNLSSNYGMSLPTPSVTLGDHFKSLIDLYIKSVNISDQVFDIILCSCSSLEKFRLVNSYSLVHAKHSGPHLKLKSFEMHFCTCLESIELVAPNLQSFKYRGFKRNIYLKGSPQLVNLGVDSIYAFDEKLSLVYPEEKHFIFDQFTACVSRLECLVAGAHLFAGRRSTKFSIFCNLKQLALDVMSYEFLQQSFHVAAFFISAAPFLQQLELNRQLRANWKHTIHPVRDSPLLSFSSSLLQ